ncbi:hypothetical protein pdam_00013002, partial [Pocillopora damicornis]
MFVVLITDCGKNHQRHAAPSERTKLSSAASRFCNISGQTNYANRDHFPEEYIMALFSFHIQNKTKSPPKVKILQKSNLICKILTQDLRNRIQQIPNNNRCFKLTYWSEKIMIIFKYFSFVEHFVEVNESVLWPSCSETKIH